MHPEDYTPYDLGFQDALMGSEPGDNPFEFGTKDYEMWADGFEDGLTAHPEEF